jgi:hypothetical protein
MKHKYLLFAIICSLAIYAPISRADVYTDATGDLFTAGAQQLDITSVVVTNDNSNLYFTIILAGNPQATNWGSYAIALVTGPGGATNSTGTTNAISLTEGINYWVNCLGWGNPQLWQYNASTLTWTNIGGAIFSNSSNSISLTVPYASVGLTNGSSFQFDAYTFSGTGGAVDDLANPVQASGYWSTPYTNNLVDIYPNPTPGYIYYDKTNDLFTAGAQQLDISSVAVAAPNSSELMFTINLVGNPQATNWGSYAIALVTGPGGATNGNGSGAEINLTAGINYWVTCLGWGNPQLWQYNTNTLTWTNIGGAIFANSPNSVSLTVPYVNVGLTPGKQFKFDAYTFSGTGGAVDDLAKSGQASSYYNVPYTNNLVETYPVAIYNDATNDIWLESSRPELDIASVGVWNDSTNLSFILNLSGNPTNVDGLGEFAVALVTGPGGATNSNGSNVGISLTEGMNYWLVSYGYGSPQLWQYNTNTLTWTNIGGATFANSSSSVSLTVPYASLGLASGSGLQFDAYTFLYGSGAVDDLANPNETINWYSQSYSSNLVKSYTLTGSVVTTLGTNAYLTSLVLTPAGLTSTFGSNTLSYLATYAYGNAPTVTVVNGDTMATNVLIYNNNIITTTNVLTSGFASAGLALTLGVTNVAQVQVTAQDGVAVQTYQVNIVEQPSQSVPKLTNSVSGGTNLVLSWPADHLGYRLLVQTNNLNKGVSSNTNDWGSVPGSMSITATNIGIIKATNNAYYRLVYP